MPEQTIIQRCARVCDMEVEELRGLKRDAPKKKYGSDARRRFDYAIRTCNRIRDRILALGPAEPPQQEALNGDKLALALDFAQSMRPVIESSKASAWRQEKLRQLDDLLR